MRFITAFTNSLWNLPWLKKAGHAPKKAWSYFFVLMTVFTVIFFIPTIIALPSAVQTLRETTAAQVPSFQATWTSGSLAVSGLSQPYVSKTANYVMVIDTISTTTVNLQSYLETKQQKVLLATKDALFILDGTTGEQQSQAWQKDFSWTVTNEQVRAWVTSHTTAGYMVFFSLILAVFIFVSLVISKLWLLAVITSLVVLVSLLMRRGWRWSELFVIGLYGMTLPSLISYLIGLIGLQLSGLYFMALLAFMLAVAFTEGENGAEIDFSDKSR